MDLRNIQDIWELRDMAREELNKDPDNRAMRLRQEAAQKNLDNIYLHPDYVTQQNIALFSRWQARSRRPRTRRSSPPGSVSSFRRSVARLRAFPSTLTTYM